MADSPSNQRAGGVGFLGALTLLFTALKLTGFIDWTWWAVTAPLWGPVSAVVVALVSYLVVLAVWDFVLRPAINWWRRK